MEAGEFQSDSSGRSRGQSVTASLQDIPIPPFSPTNEHFQVWNGFGLSQEKFKKSLLFVLDLTSAAKCWLCCVRKGKRKRPSWSHRGFGTNRESVGRRSFQLRKYRQWLLGSDHRKGIVKREFWTKGGCGSPGASESGVGSGGRRTQQTQMQRAVTGSWGLCLSVCARLCVCVCHCKSPNEILINNRGVSL